MSKDSRSGGKYTGSHTTLTPFAREVCDLVTAVPIVTKVSLGVIKAGLPSVNGNRRVKIVNEGTCVLLAIRDNASHQEVRVYGEVAQQTVVVIARRLRDHDISIRFK